MSAQGGAASAIERAAQLQATALALYTKNQRQWTAPALTEAEVREFREACERHHFTPAQILPHAGYLINIGNADDAKRARSVEALKDELQRCATLGLTMLNLHPGSHLNAVRPGRSLQLQAYALDEALEAVAGVDIVLENTAGQGTNMGYELEQLAWLIDHSAHGERLGVCIDTCHAWAAGYDLVSREGYRSFWEIFDKLLGPGRLRGMHLNDAMKARGSKVDRHASLGEGTIDMALFQRLMEDPRTNGIPLIIETPDEDRWPAEVALLLHLATRGDGQNDKAPTDSAE